MQFLDFAGVKDLAELSYATDPTAAEAFFRETAAFWDLAPWEVLGEREPLEVEGIDPQTVLISVRGEEEEPGLALFASRQDMQAGRPRAWLHFGMEPGPTLAAEIAANGWTLGQRDAIPLAAEAGRPGIASPTTLAMIARAMHVVARFLKQGLEEEDEVRGKQLKLPSGLKVLVTWKGDPDVFGKPVAPPAKEAPKKPAGPPPITREAKPGRNEPCWCGSGQKYKKCHLAEDEAQSRG